MHFRLLTLAMVGLFGAASLPAQDLAPRAYVITPLQFNAVTISYSYYRGNILFDGAAPITGATASINTPTVTYYHSLDFFGHSANFTAGLPYGIGTFQGTALGAEKSAYRSGLMDLVARFSVNLIGGPAMSSADLRKLRQKRILGVSFKLLSPTGQYDPTELVNWSANRWAFKPEIGYSRRWGHWVIDAYAAAWFYTTNPEYFSHNTIYPGTRWQSENPVAAFEGHLSYDVKPRLWISLDGNY